MSQASENTDIASFGDTSSQSHEECIITSLKMPNQETASETILQQLLVAIMQGNSVEVEALLEKNPDFFFKKDRVTNNYGLTFNSISPYQLITFLCDADMFEKIAPLIPTDKYSCTKLLEQDAEMDGGGVDLIKMDRDPTYLSYDEISTFIDKSEIDRSGYGSEVIYPLLKNLDGIIFFENHLYYASRDLENRQVSVELIHTSEASKQDHLDLSEFRASMAAMENNSGRRSTDDEHAFIANKLQHTLIRQGIQFERNGIRYRDTQDEFFLINNYRTYIRMSKEKCTDAVIDALWLSQIGGGQRKAPMWLLQRLCEALSFIPFPDFKESPFARDTKFFNVTTHVDECILSSTPERGLGIDYALFKVGARRPSVIGGAAGGPYGAPTAAARLDLAAIRNVIDMGIADVAAIRKKLVTQAEAVVQQNH